MKKIIIMTGASVALFFGAYSAMAWTGPLSAPPACTSGNPGCDAPLNVTSAAQIKTGSLTAGGLSARRNLC